MIQAVVSSTGHAVTAGEQQPFSLAQALLWLQGPYYLLTGIWPLISIHTFQMVTGKKYDHLPNGTEADHWLVFAVGILITSIALTLLLAAWRRTASLEIAVLAIGSAAGLTAIDVIYVARNVIAPIYLVDAAVEVPLIAGWIIVLAQKQYIGGRVSKSILSREAPHAK